MNNYNIDYISALEIVNNMNIIHPYGFVGNGNFGEISMSRELINVSNNIKLYTEEIQSQKTYMDLFSNVEETYKVIFLGFAYHKQNMDLIFQKQFENYNINCFYGTGLGISNNDINYLQEYYTSRLHRSMQFEIVNKDCKQFFDEFYYRISFME
jgi:hypothetical protein